MNRITVKYIQHLNFKICSCSYQSLPILIFATILSIVRAAFELNSFFCLVFFFDSFIWMCASVWSEFHISRPQKTSKSSIILITRGTISIVIREPTIRLTQFTSRSGCNDQVVRHAGLSLLSLVWIPVRETYFCFQQELSNC